MADLPPPPALTPVTLPPDAAALSAEGDPQVVLRRDRLLAALTLTSGIGLMLGLPFALKSGAEFFMPTAVALVVALALIPLLEWLERRRLPSALAALVCVLLFLLIANVALAAIVVPATEFFRLLPSRIGRIQDNLAPLLDLYSSLEKYANRTLRQIASTPVRPSPTAAVAPPSSIVELAATSAPAVIIQVFYAILVAFFFLSGWTRTRERMITERASFGGAMATARVLQEMVDDVSSYLGTITVINVALGAIIAGALHLLGMPFPLMWGGIVALLNYIPYFGPVVAALLLAVGGLMTFSDVWTALSAPAIMYGAHLIEANVVTPLIVGHRLTINPVMILISISFWGWVWGTVGALLAVPILIIVQTILSAAGRPDIAGFLFEHGTLTRTREGRSGVLARRGEKDAE
ncbi:MULTISPECIES: AI-2E family transporter [unclassified Sphingomonas]|uniref:AI-2E family transporter n=1 Tax=unclassified Sphingomonas TaxID=196159 RepID=UPI0016184818|nr:MULTISPECIES: AI-2E family transporter [unclassified Sphingomonas]MBB3346700.1 putative PurR-regulated permease PerM [Sphingomonas sp. BK069]MBB3472983.1 putative PurR-regulated permease PerM [Sphingomonas sp. BK345]